MVSLKEPNYTLNLDILGFTLFIKSKLEFLYLSTRLPQDFGKLSAETHWNSLQFALKQDGLVAK